MNSLVLFWKQRRYIVCFYTFLGFLLQYMMRMNLSLTIVTMTNEFNWTPKQKGPILSSFFYGYAITQLPGGYLANRIGGKKVLLGSVCLGSLCSLLTPICAENGIIILMAIRIISGLCQGVLFPCAQAIFSKWIPPSEKSRLPLITMSGAYLGSLITMFTTGYLCDAVSWQFVFYLHGCFGIIWCFLWIFLTSETPLVDKRISEIEKEYLIKSLHLQSDQSKTNPKPPMKSILLSLPVWAIIISHFASSWGFFLLFTIQPTFFKDMHNLNIKTIGVLSSLPYFALLVLNFVAGYLADMFIRKKYMKVVNVRKLCNCGAFFLNILGFIGAAFWLTPTGSVICFTVAISVGAFSWAGFGINHLDLCPQFASVTMGLSNTAGALPGILAPIIWDKLTSKYKTKKGYQISFYIATIICVIGFVVYIIFAKGVEQPWAKPKKLDEDLVPKSDTIQISNESIVDDKETSTKGKETLFKHKDTFTKDKESFARDKESPSKKHKSSPNTDRSSKLTETWIKYRNKL